MQVYGRFPYNSQFLCKKEKKQRELLPDDPQEIEHVDAVLKLLSVITGDDSYRNIKLPEGKRKISMCDVAQNLIKQGIAEGEAKEFWITNFTIKPPYGEHKGACSNFEQ